MTGGRRLEPAQRRLRARTDGEWVIDTTDTWLLYEPGRHPTFVVPSSALPALDRTDGRTDERGGRWMALAGRADRRVRLWDSPPPDIPELVDLAAIPLDIADEWYEEDVQMSFKPRDPYRRVDVLESSRRVTIHVENIVVAETDRPRLVLETGMPPIWYVPLAAVDVDWLRPTQLRTLCQYKGTAHYWDVVTSTGTHEELAWGYPDPISAASKLAGHVAFAPWHPDVTTTVGGHVQHVDDPHPSWSNPSSHLAQARR
ncbi:MAG: DUF427 domain-containing protein [Actinomycetota bacterium]